MRTRPRRPLLALAATTALVALAGCSGSDEATPTPSAVPEAPGASAPSTPAASEPAAPSASPSPSLETLPARQCLTGTWQLVRFVGASDQTYGTGQGGDVTVRFGDGSYTLRGAGAEPITITLAGGSAGLRVDGEAEGTFTLDGATATFTQRSATGSAELEAGTDRQRLDMDQVTRVVGLTGDGQVACTRDAMTVTLSGVRLELGRG